MHEEQELYGNHEEKMKEQLHDLYAKEPMGRNKRLTGSMGEIPFDVER